MRKFFRRFLCVIGFVALTVVCARADTTLLVVNQLTPDAVSVIDGKQNVKIALDNNIFQAVLARVVLFNKHDKYAILSVENGSALTGYGGRESYWLRSCGFLKDVHLFEEQGYLMRRHYESSIGKLDQVVTVVSRLGAAMVSDIPDDGSESGDSSGVADAGYFSDGSSADYDIPYMSPPASPAHSPVSLDQRRSFKLTILDKDGVPRVFECTTFHDETFLEALVGGTITGVERFR